VARALYLLDTNTVSFLVNGRSPAVRTHYVEAESQGARIAISAITEAELLFGLARRPEATRLKANFDRFFAAVELLAWDSTVARAYGDLRGELSGAGKSLALMDLLIAAHAIAAAATLVTHDKAFLEASPSLQVVDWATDL
jgi:tRNA(fMet)-specific endonuclease VapC